MAAIDEASRQTRRSLVLGLAALVAGTLLLTPTRASAQLQPGYAGGRVGEPVVAWPRGTGSAPEACRITAVLDDQRAYMVHCNSGDHFLGFWQVGQWGEQVAAALGVTQAPKVPPTSVVPKPPVPPVDDEAEEDEQDDAEAEAEKATMTDPLPRCFGRQRVLTPDGDLGTVTAVSGAVERTMGTRCDVLIDGSDEPVEFDARDLHGTTADAAKLNRVPKLKTGRYRCKDEAGDDVGITVHLTSTRRYKDGRNKSGAYKQTGALVQFTSGPLEDLVGTALSNGTLAIEGDEIDVAYCTR